MIARTVLFTQSTLEPNSTIAFVIFYVSIIIRELILIVICSSMSNSSKCDFKIDSYFMESFIICPSGNTYPIPILQSTTIRLCNPLTHFMHSSSSLSAFSSLLNNRIHLYIIIIHHYSILFLQPAKFIDITIHLYLSHSTDLQYPNFTYPTI